MISQRPVSRRTVVRTAATLGLSAAVLPNCSFADESDAQTFRAMMLEFSAHVSDQREIGKQIGVAIKAKDREKTQQLSKQLQQLSAKIKALEPATVAVFRQIVPHDQPPYDKYSWQFALGGAVLRATLRDASSNQQCGYVTLSHLKAGKPVFSTNAYKQKIAGYKARIGTNTANVWMGDFELQIVLQENNRVPGASGKDFIGRIDIAALGRKLR